MAPGPNGGLGIVCELESRELGAERNLKISMKTRESGLFHLILTESFEAVTADLTLPLVNW